MCISILQKVRKNLKIENQSKFAKKVEIKNESTEVSFLDY